jgi:xylulokinase
MQKICFLGIDVGTTGAKAALFDEEGTQLNIAYKEYPCNYIKPGWVEQDAALLANTVHALIKEVMGHVRKTNYSIAAVATSAQRNSVIFTDNDENPLKMIGWQDSRAVEECREIEKRTGVEAFYRTCGLPLSPMWILPKLMWVKKNESDLWKKTKRIVQLNDFILKNLGAADYYMDDGCANNFGFWDLKNRCYSDQMISEYGIPKDRLPIHVLSGTKIGAVSGEVSRMTGLPAGTPLCVGAGDQNAATVGAGVVEEGRLSVSLGTGGIAIAYMDKLIMDPAHKIMVANHAIDGKWEYEGLQKASAGIFRWFRDEVATLDNYLAEQNGENYYEKIEAKVAAVPAGAKGLLLLPYFSGSAVPQWDDNARGALLGLSFSHDTACMARAFMEGVVMEQKKIIEHFRESGICVQDIRVIGGVTKSDVWNQIQADMYDTPVKLPVVRDAAVLGAAICAAVGSGAYASIKEAAGKMVKIEKVYQPIKENVRIYNDNFAIYKDAYKTLTDCKVFERIVAKQTNDDK